MDIDFNDPEILRIIEIRAAQEGCSPEHLKIALEKAHNLPPLFDQDPLKNLDGLKEFFNSVPWNRVEMVRWDMIEKDPSKTHWTTGDVLRQLIADQVEKEVELLPEKERLEKLFETDMEEGGK